MAVCGLAGDVRSHLLQTIEHHVDVFFFRIWYLKNLGRGEVENLYITGLTPTPPARTSARRRVVGRLASSYQLRPRDKLPAAQQGSMSTAWLAGDIDCHGGDGLSGGDAKRWTIIVEVVMTADNKATRDRLVTIYSQKLRRRLRSFRSLTD